MQKTALLQRHPHIAVLLAFPASLIAMVAVANVKLPEAGDEISAALSTPAAVIEQASTPINTAGEISRNRVAERLFKSSWGNADPEVYARIAMAFDTEPLRDAELRAVECRAQVCRVSFDARADLPVRKLLPVQLARSFNTMVTVHEGDTNLVYVDVPDRG